MNILVKPLPVLAWLFGTGVYFLLYTVKPWTSHCWVSKFDSDLVALAWYLSCHRDADCVQHPIALTWRIRTAATKPRQTLLCRSLSTSQIKSFQLQPDSSVQSIDYFFSNLFPCPRWQRYGCVMKRKTWFCLGICFILFFSLHILSLLWWKIKNTKEIQFCFLNIYLIFMHVYLLVCVSMFWVFVYGYMHMRPVEAREVV